MVLTMQGIATLNYQPLTGIQQAPAMHHAAKILADMGREEDTYIVHAAEGETVIPMEVMEANPKMAEMVYKQNPPGHILPLILSWICLNRSYVVVRDGRDEFHYGTRFRAMYYDQGTCNYPEPKLLLTDLSITNNIFQDH